MHFGSPNQNVMKTYLKSSEFVPFGSNMPKSHINPPPCPQSRGVSFWFPPEPQGESLGLGLMERDEARRTAFTAVQRNVVHSNQVSILASLALS